MPRQSMVYEVLIASPSDVHKERTVLTEVIEDWNSANSQSRGISLQPLRWELDSVPESGGRPQEIINKQLVANADILMAVFWSRMGTPTGDAISGTVEEIEHFRKAGKRVLLYFSEANIPLNHDAEQLQKLRKYQKAVEGDNLYDTFRDSEELRRRAARHLARVMNEMVPATGMRDNVEIQVRRTPEVQLVFGSTSQSLLPGTSIKPVKVHATIQNLSSTKRIREYSVTLSVPRCCLSFQSASYPNEVQSRDPNYRKMRHTEQNWGGRVILPEDNLEVISVEVTVGHLPSEQREACLKTEFIGELVTDGNAFETRTTLAELLAGRI